MIYLTTSLGGREDFFYPHYMEQETEAQGVCLHCIVKPGQCDLDLWMRVSKPMLEYPRCIVNLGLKLLDPGPTVTLTCHSSLRKPSDSGLRLDLCPHCRMTGLGPESQWVLASDLPPLAGF